MVEELARVRLTPHGLPGFLVAVDGTVGTGKTTLLDGLEGHLRTHRISYLRTRQPTTEARELEAFEIFLFAPEQRREIDYRALLCMMIGDRLQHIHRVVKPALAAGKVVLCDRYIFTQMVTTRTRGFQDEPWMYELYDHVVRPDLGLITDAPLDIACSRISGREDWRESFLERDHVARDLEAYRAVARIFGLTVLDTHTHDQREVLARALMPLEEWHGRVTLSP